jgi:predicted RNA-binding protein with PIN domain
MSKRTYIIDGYNAIHRVREWEEIMDKELARSREVLCQFCSQWMASRRDAEKFIVVFDGDSSVSPFSNDAYRGVRIIFTATGETADSRIISIVEEMGSPQDAVVVSDDGEVMKRCGMAGAETSSVRNFVGTLRKPGSGNSVSSGDDSDGLTPAERNRITNDLKREWGIE